MKTKIKKQVMNYQVDGFNIVHHARYLEMLEEGRWHYCRENNLIEAFHKEELSHVVVNMNINYHISAVLGDELTILTELFDVTEKSLTFRQVIYKNEKEVLDMTVTNVFLKENRTIQIEKMTSFWNDVNDLLDSRGTVN